MGRRGEIIILPDMLVGAARHAGVRPGGAGHERLEAGRYFIHAKQLMQAAARVVEDRQGLDPHARQPGNFKAAAHFNRLP